VDRGASTHRGKVLCVSHPVRLLVALLFIAGNAVAQTCTTQAKMTPEVRDSLSGAALTFAGNVKSNNSVAAQAVADQNLTANFGPTAYLIRTTADKLTGSTLRVTQLYMLDASARAASDTTEVDFACPLTGLTSETDFAIPGLPPGTYGFAMVEAEGAQPWLLAAIFRRESDSWRLAGFYPHPREAAGHDGIWYWTAARKAAGSKDLWLAWLYYGEADQLSRPASFVSSTNLDKLRSEARSATPPELSDGISAETPLVVKAMGGAQFDFTAIRAEGSEDGKRLNLMLHMRADPIDDPAAARARNQAAAHAFLAAHKDLREVFNGVWVFAESAGHEPFATEQSMSAIPQ
jgi:hypothetical protein